jgi:hypothetical protein
METKKPKSKAGKVGALRSSVSDTAFCFDEVDGMMTLPPENRDTLEEQVEYMRCKLNRPTVKDKDITIALLQWQWAWLHMRYQTPDNSENGLRILRWHTSREVSYRKEYEKDEVARSGEEE